MAVMDKKAYSHQYYLANRERLSALNKAWYLTHKAERAVYRKRAYEKHHDDFKAYGQTPQRRLAAYKSGAKQRGLSFDLTQEEFMTFWQVPCSYCGSSIDTIGLDRIDSGIGYTMTNIVSCCVVCNKMKLAMDTDTWFAQMHRILAYSESV
jgi:hypothetical protein